MECTEYKVAYCFVSHSLCSKLLLKNFRMVREGKPQLDSMKKELLLHMKNHIVATMNARREVIFLSNSKKKKMFGIVERSFHIIQLLNEFKRIGITSD